MGKVFQRQERDLAILRCIADGRLLTVRQLAAALAGNLQSTRRRVRMLHAQGLLHWRRRQPAGGRGRMERLVSLTPVALELLKDRGILDEAVPAKWVLADRLKAVEHQHLLNWFCIHLAHAQNVLGSVRLQCWTHNSPFTPREASGRVIIADRSGDEPASGKGPDRFIPDAAIRITDTPRDKTVLLFLEVDCGTEAVTSGTGSGKDIAQKLQRYGAYFDSGRYRRYETLWDCRLRGFRMLLLCQDPQRVAQLSALVRSCGGMDFVWLTDEGRMFSEGLTGGIWVRGGQAESGGHSVFGSLACRAPLPAVYTAV